jgi:hypothetical protein
VQFLGTTRKSTPYKLIFKMAIKEIKQVTDYHAFIEKDSPHILLATRPTIKGGDLLQLKTILTSINHIYPRATYTILDSELFHSWFPDHVNVDKTDDTEGKRIHIYVVSGEEVILDRVLGIDDQLKGQLEGLAEEVAFR